MHSIDMELTSLKTLAKSMDPSTFRALLDNKESVLVIDCRPFLLYNVDHIMTAVNVHCPPILKRRSGGYIPLENVVPCEQSRNKLISGQFSTILVYDQDTEDLVTCTKDSNLYLVLKTLKQRSHDIGTVTFLKGGYSAFLQQHPHLCVSQASAMAQSWSENAASLVAMATLDTPTTIDKRRECNPVEILPHLYLGDVRHAGDLDILQQLKISALLNVSSSCKNYFPEQFVYKTIPVDDTSSADLESWFPSAIEFIDMVKENGGRVLVHCKAGISRSATICLAYLMYTKHLSLEAAYEYIQTRRSVISPNLNFMRQLKEYETSLAPPIVRAPPPVPKSFTVLWNTIAAGETPDFSDTPDNFFSSFGLLSPIQMFPSSPLMSPS